MSLTKFSLAGEYAKENPLLRDLHIGLTFLSYAVARILKKTGKLRQPELQPAGN